MNLPPKGKLQNQTIYALRCFRAYSNHFQMTPNVIKSTLKLQTIILAISLVYFRKIIYKNSMCFQGAATFFFSASILIQLFAWFTKNPMELGINQAIKKGKGMW